MRLVVRGAGAGEPALGVWWCVGGGGGPLVGGGGGQLEAANPSPLAAPLSPYCPPG